MRAVIGGYKDFENGDVLTIKGVEKARVEFVDGNVQLAFKDKNNTKMYIGKVGDFAIDDLINTVWSTLCLEW